MRSVTSGMFVSWHALFKSKSSLAFCSLSSPERRGRRQDNMIPSVCVSITGLAILCLCGALRAPRCSYNRYTHASNVPSSWHFNTFLTCIVFPRCWLKFNPWLRRSLDKLIMWDFIDQGEILCLQPGFVSLKDTKAGWIYSICRHGGLNLSHLVERAPHAATLHAR